MRVILTAAGVLAALSATPAMAQAAPQGATPTPAQTTPAQTAPQPANVTVGASVTDATGAPVGTIAQIDGANAIVDTGTNKVGVAKTSFSQGPNGLLLGATKAQLDAAASQAAAQSKAQVDTLLVVGADVRGVNGRTIGKVKEVGADYVTVTPTKGGDVRLARSGFAATPTGLAIGMAQADFDKAVAAATK